MPRDSGDPPEPSFIDHLPLTSAAVRFAERRHAGQLRASDSAPFVLHPIEVASMLDRSGYPDHVVAAAVLHDVLEDTDSERSELEALFGREVSDLVASVSDDPEIADEWDRKADVRERVRRAGGYAMPVFAADKISKVRELRALMAQGLPEEEAAPRLDLYKRALAMLDEQAPGSRLTELLRFELETIERLPPAPGGPRGELPRAARRDTEIRPALLALRKALLEAEACQEEALARVPAQNRRSARNLIHYVELRRHDLRALQGRLEREGLSSMGRCEPHVLATLDAVLGRLDGAAGARAGASPGAVGFDEGPRLMAERTQALLGPEPGSRPTRLMVTAPSEAATDERLLERMLDAGMDSLRINCAHDDSQAWEAIAENLGRAVRRRDRRCRIQMDVPGPKLRTGPLPPGPSVIRVRPHRDELGRLLSPARVWLTGAERPAAPPGPADATLPVPAGWLSKLPADGRIVMRDARGKLRAMDLDGAADGGRWARLDRTAYVLEHTVLWPQTADSEPAPVGELRPLSASIRLRAGETLRLTRDQGGGDIEGRSIPCALEDVFASVSPGDPIWFDDGRIGGTVVDVSTDEISVRVTHAGPDGAKLRADKGINLPQTELAGGAITQADELAMRHVASLADMVGLSFVSTPGDVHRARALLHSHGGDQVGIVLKVETERGFRALPELLLAALEHQAPVGVMIARGDLAVECGFERLAEVQEEILWLSEAAHVPVIWATQVLEGLAKTGRASRAEITDAAMGARAECVMLNKGPRIIDAVQALDDILIRMQGHQRKKQSLLRELRSFSGSGFSQSADDPALLIGS